MDNKNEIIDDFEIFEENDFNNLSTDNSIPTNIDWMADVSSVENLDNQFEPHHNEVQDVPTNVSLVNDLEEEPIVNNVILEEPILEPELESTLSAEILNNVEIANPDNNVSYQANLPEQKEDNNDELEEEINSSRSLTFIVVLFAILIIFIVMLPIITNVLK